MVTNAERVAELRLQLRRVMRGMWARRRPTPELMALAEGGSLGRRHVAVLAQVGTEGERSVGELASELGLSLPAVSTLARELEEHGLLERREDETDRRRTVVALAPATEQAVRGWLAQRSRPLEQALAALDRDQRLPDLRRGHPGRLGRPLGLRPDTRAAAGPRLPVPVGRRGLRLERLRRARRRAPARGRRLLPHAGDGIDPAFPTFLGELHDMGRAAQQIVSRAPGLSGNALLQHVELGWSLLYLLRGAPVVQWGDEVGMIGSGGDKAAREDMSRRR